MLRYACAGHHPAYLLSVDADGRREAMALRTRGLVIGAMLLEQVPEAAERLPEAQRLYRAVRKAARPGPLDDDFSLVVVTFP
jgi:hypothetical protein